MLFSVATLQPAPAATQLDECDQLFSATEATRDTLRAQIRRRGQRDAETLVRFARAARAARRCYGSREPERVALLYQREVYGLEALGHHSSVLQAADAFLDQFGDVGAATARAYVLQRRAQAQVSLGRTGEGIQSLKQALHLAEALSVPRRVDLHLELATVYQSLADFETARHHYARAEEILVQSGRGEGRFMAQLLNGRAEMAVVEADFLYRRDPAPLLDAAKQAQRAVQLFARENRTLGASVAHVKAAEALAYAGRPEEAVPHMEAALQLAEQSGHAATRMTVAYKMARLQVQRNYLEEAGPYLHDALRLAQEEDHLDYLRRITYFLGMLHEMQDELAEAEQWYRRSVAYTEDARDGLALTEWSPLAFAHRQDAYRGLVRVKVRQGRVEEALVELELTRSRHLYDLRRAHAATVRLSLGERNQLDSLVAELERVRDRLRPQSASDPRRLKHEILETALMLEINQVLGVRGGPPRVDVDSLQATLAADDRTLVSYFIDQSGRVMPRERSSYAFVVTPDTVLARPLAAGELELRSLVEDVSPMLVQDRARYSVSDVQFDLDALHSLYDVLFAPIVDLVPEGRRLVVIPDGILNTLPFGMLVKETTGRYDYHEARYLLEKHPVAVDVSAAFVERDASARTHHTGVAAFGRADFSALRQQMDRGSSASRLRGIVAETAGFFDLPSVEVEVREIERLFAGARVAVNEHARESLLYERVDSAAVLHVASHATVDAGSPLYNAIVLAPDDDGGEDGFVHLYELQNRRMSVPLVVLSGCNTARGALDLGEGLRGLHFGFRAAGARSLLATLWFVDDAASVGLLHGFYRYLQNSTPKDVAIQQAQLDYLHRAEPAKLSPFFWAAPVVYGQAGPLDLEPASRARAWWLTALLGLFVLGLVFAHRLRSIPDRCS